MLYPKDLEDQAKDLLEACLAAGKRVTTAESCTGGLISGLLTEIPGSSKTIGRSFVTYSNHAKAEVLGVPKEILRDQGAVAADTVRAMAEGALAASGKDADIAVAVSGVAGPDGGSPEKPVGTVFMAVASRDGETVAERLHFEGDRTKVRLDTVKKALEMLRERVG